MKTISCNLYEYNYPCSFIIRKTILATILFIAVVFSLFSQNSVGIGTTTPDASAILELRSANKGFLPPRMGKSQMEAISKRSPRPATGLIVYCTDCESKGIYVYKGGGFKLLAFFEETESSYTENTTEIVEVEYNGRTWMDRNLGASQRATRIDDPASYGDLYQWGRIKDGHEKRNSETTEELQPSDYTGGKFIKTVRPYNMHKSKPTWTTARPLESWQNGINDPCPEGYRVPTSEELFSVLSRDGNIPNSVTRAYAFDNTLKLPAAGKRDYNGDVVQDGTSLYYWSKSVFPLYVEGVYPVYSLSTGFDGQVAEISATQQDSVYKGYSVRCIKKLDSED